MQIAELAKLAGLAPSALRYYEERGLLSPLGRTQAGYRLYGEDAVLRVRFIHRAKALGLTLREINQLTQEPTELTGGQARLRHALVHKLADTRHRMNELETLHTELEDQLTRLGSTDTCGHVGDCGCWLPSREEVKQMTSDVVNETGCTCCGCTCSSDGDCTCCGCADPNC